MKNSNLVIRKNSRNYFPLSLNKKSLYGFLLISCMLIFLLPDNSSAQSCSLTLSAKNNIESVNDEGRVYFITLQNNGNEAISVDLSVLNRNSEMNPDQTPTTFNVSLSAEILNSAGKAINGKINVAPKELQEFQVKVTVPQGTPINRWNHLLLKAAADKCSGYESTLILYTYVPNPEEK
jgi:hypothetical protein